MLVRHVYQIVNQDVQMIRWICKCIQDFAADRFIWSVLKDFLYWKNKKLKPAPFMGNIAMDIMI